MMASLKGKQSKLSFSNFFRYVYSLKEFDAVRYCHGQFYSIHGYFLKRFVFLYSNNMNPQTAFIIFLSNNNAFNIFRL